jgi:hypothetical protein
MAVAAAAVLLALVTRRMRGGVLACVGAIGAVAFASHFAINSDAQTFQFSGSAPDNRSLYHAAVDNVAFINRATTRDEPLPRFWYPAANGLDFTSIQSMYFYDFTAIGYRLPKVTADVRQRLDLWKPRSIVMLCETRDCGDAAAALRRAGYGYKEDKAKRISRGRIRLWTVLIRSYAGPTTVARCEIQDGDLLRAPPASEIYAFWAGRKHWIVSMDVLLDVFGPNAVASIKDVVPRTLRRMPSGRSLGSAQVWAEIRGSSTGRRPRPPAC